MTAAAQILRGGRCMVTARIADSLVSRGRGLLGRLRLRPGEGLLAQPCGSVHTWFTAQALDLVGLGRTESGCATVTWPAGGRAPSRGGALNAAHAAVTGDWPSIAATVAFAMGLTYIAAVDVRTRRLPNAVTLYGTVLALALSSSGGHRVLRSSVLGIALVLTGAVFMLSRGGFGMGDVKLSAFVGVVIGLGAVRAFLVLACCLGGIAALIVLLRGAGPPSHDRLRALRRPPRQSSRAPGLARSQADSPADSISPRSRCSEVASHGGSAWVSNPPGTATRPRNGFEDRGHHRTPSTPARMIAGGGTLGCATAGRRSSSCRPRRSA